MERRGLRAVLEPALYFVLAMSLHLVLFLIPGGGGGAKSPVETTRGVRVKTFVENPQARPSSAPPTPQARPAAAPEPPATVARGGSATGGPPGPQGGGGGRPGDPGSTPVGPGGAPGGGPGSSGGESRTAFGDYLGKLRSENVQGWAKETADRSRQGWKGKGGGTGGWGTGTGTGTGSGSGQGGGSGSGSGSGTGSGAGGGGRAGDGSGYLDPRVRMVVTSYPPTSIERRFTMVPYPDVRLKKHQVASGWWNVYIQIRTDGSGKVTRYDVLRPETDGPIEKIFVEQVRKEVSRWGFDQKEAEIHIDVRFYVE